MAFVDKAKMFLMKNKNGAIIGGLIGLGFGTMEFFKMAWLQTVFFPGAYVAGSLSFIVNILWGIAIGAALQHFLRKGELIK